jgi:hypothetical protein
MEEHGKWIREACNMSGNPYTAVAAVSLPGSHTRIRRVKAINWGTEIDAAECIVLAIGGVHPEAGGHGGVPRAVQELLSGRDC